MRRSAATRPQDTGANTAPRRSRATRNTRRFGRTSDENRHVTAAPGETAMTVVTTIDVYAMPPEEYRAILNHMGVETRPAAGLFLHLTSKTDFGFRVVEIWDRKEGFDEFLTKRL